MCRRTISCNPNPRLVCPATPWATPPRRAGRPLWPAAMDSGGLGGEKGRASNARCEAARTARKNGVDCPVCAPHTSGYQAGARIPHGGGFRKRVMASARIEPWTGWGQGSGHNPRSAVPLVNRKAGLAAQVGPRTPSHATPRSTPASTDLAGRMRGGAASWFCPATLTHSSVRNSPFRVNAFCRVACQPAGCYFRIYISKSNNGK